MTKAALSPQLFKDPECWSGRDLNLRPPVQQPGALPTELTGLGYFARLHFIEHLGSNTQVFTVLM